jgi:hypothetical protein
LITLAFYRVNAALAAWQAGQNTGQEVNTDLFSIGQFNTLQE